MQQEKSCNVEGCNGKSYCHGMCIMHYTRWKKCGDPGPAASMNERHGMHGTRVYRTWQGIVQRCCNPNDMHYPIYGGRGIKICAEWRASFSAFYRDMGDPPSAKHQIDRIDGDQDYRKENCRWVLPRENQRNRKVVKLSMEKAREIRCSKLAGETNRQLAERFGVGVDAIEAVLRGKNWNDRMEDLRQGEGSMTIGYKHPGVDMEVYLDGCDEIACRKKLEELCAKRDLPAEGWLELEDLQAAVVAEVVETAK